MCIVFNAYNDYYMAIIIAHTIVLFCRYFGDTCRGLTLLRNLAHQNALQ